MAEASRLSDSEIEIYHGGREAYVARLQARVGAIDAGTAPKEDFGGIFCNQDNDELAQLVAAIAANS